MEHKEFQITLWCEPCAMHFEYIDISYPNQDRPHEAYKEEANRAKGMLVAHSNTRSHKLAVKAEQEDA